jgi:hypothetical protein
VTRDSQATGSPRHAAGRPALPEPGRPSLFADFDPNVDDRRDTQRIRLLSTLESQRGGRTRPRSRRQPTGRGHRWLTRSLFVVMGLGVLVMLASFAQLLRRGPEVSPSRVTPAHAGASLESLRISPVLATPDPISRAAEIVEVDAPGAAPTAGPGLPAHQPGPSPMRASPRGATVAIAATTPEADHRDPRPARQAHPANNRDSPRREANEASADVALVEAMLVHAGPRKAPPSPSEALKRCNAAAAPEAASCRARVCTQHPAPPGCHAD